MRPLSTPKNIKNTRMRWLFAALVWFAFLPGWSCGNTQQRNHDAADTTQDSAIRTGADQLDRYLPLLADKKVGLMGNQTSVVGDRHLVDVMLEDGVDLQFA